MLRILDREFRRYETGNEKTSGAKPLSDDIAYPLISWFAKEKEEKHFSWDGRNIWPYRRELGVGIHLRYFPKLMYSDESRRGPAKKLQEALESVVKGGFSCEPWDLRIEATVGSEVPEIDEISIPYVFCTSKYEFHTSESEFKKAWAIAFSYAKKANASDLGKEYAVTPDVWHCGSRRHPRYCLGVKLLPRSEISRFRQWLSSMVEKVKEAGAPEEEDIEGRIASLI